jgi:serine/threonine protein kinase
MRAAPPQLGRYRVDELLGSGGMALVYRGHDAKLQRPVAIKLLADNLSGDDTFRRRFVREARTVARLTHPNVVRIYDVGEVEGRPYFVMELVEGETLANRLRRHGRLPVDEAVRIAIAVCGGLEHAHRAGLVHRDVKPHNLLLTPDGGVKIVDFGIARSLDATAITESGSIVGTAAYLAPEQACGVELTPATDVYALGVVLYEMVAGHTPFDVETLAQVLHAGRRVPPVSTIAAEAPATLDDIVRKCLARDPSRRPTVAELSQRLHAIAAELPTSLTPSARPVAKRPSVSPAATRVRTRVAPQPAAPRRGRRRALFWLVPGIVVALTIALTLTFSRGASTRTPRPAPERPLPAAPEAQARELSTWLRMHAAGA